MDISLISFQSKYIIFYLIVSASPPPAVLLCHLPSVFCSFAGCCCITIAGGACYITIAVSPSPPPPPATSLYKVYLYITFTGSLQLVQLQYRFTIVSKIREETLVSDRSPVDDSVKKEDDLSDSLSFQEDELTLYPLVKILLL